jgi:hypothetical protein
MPFKSQCQAKKFRVMEAQGELPKGTSHRWAEHTPGGIKSLPEKKKKQVKQAALSAFVFALRTGRLRKAAAPAPAPVAPAQPSYPGPMQPLPASQPSLQADVTPPSEQIAQQISQAGPGGKGRMAYERLKQRVMTGGAKGYAAAAQPGAKKRFLESFRAASEAKSSEVRIGTPFMDGFLTCCLAHKLEGPQVCDLLEKAAAHEGQLGEEARGFIDRMAKL